MKISEIITDKYKLRISPTVYYELLADVQELEGEQEPREITIEDVKGYCKPRCLTIISDELLHELTHPKIKALEQEPKSEWEQDHAILKAYSDGASAVCDKIRAEIEKAVWEDSIYSRDGADEVRIPRLDPDDVFAILDKYKAGSEDK